MAEKISLLETISIAVGGMGGGIFAVLGVVAAGAGTAAWIAFTIAGITALSAGYSFVRLNNLCTGIRGGARCTRVEPPSNEPGRPRDRCGHLGGRPLRLLGSETMTRGYSGATAM